MQSNQPAQAAQEVSKAPTGITGFDEITRGGLPVARTTLLVGGPGSGKTILGLQFLAHGARECKEPGIFVAFEESSRRIEANAESFGWGLAELLRKKILFFLDAQPKSDLVQSGDFDLGGMLAALEAQTQAMQARRIVFDALDVVLALLPDPAAKRREIYRLHEWLLARGLTGIITAKAGGDPVSTWYKSSNDTTAQSVADQLIDWTKGEGITLVCTSLLDEMTNRIDTGSKIQISTLADTWIHLNYLVQAGERNRGLSIVKSRGTAHSNQVRELILSDAGVTLADTFTAGGEVLMGTLRWENERDERVATEAAETAAKLKRITLDAEEAGLEARVKSLQAELAAKQAEKALLVRATKSHEGELSRGRTQIKELRGDDVTIADGKTSPP